MVFPVGKASRLQYFSCLLRLNVGLNFSRRLLSLIREFTKPRRQRQWERRETKELMNRTMVLHVRYNFWYISLSSSSKRRREMTKFCVV